MNFDSLMSISMIKVSKVDSINIDVDSSVKSTKVTFTVFLGKRAPEENLFHAFPVIQIKCVIT